MQWKHVDLLHIQHQKSIHFRVKVVHFKQKWCNFYANDYVGILKGDASHAKSFTPSSWKSY